MKILRLNKQNEPDIDELFRMLSDLEGFLDEDVNINDELWNQNFQTVLDFQDPDGSFNLLNFIDMPSDARVDFYYMPTYVCTAVLMKTYLTDSSRFNTKEKSALSKGLKMSCCRNLSGHGYGGFKGQIEALNIFMKGGVREFIDLFPDFCPKFSEMIRRIISSFRDMESQGKFFGSWGESYETEIKAINEYFSNRNVFVYGTLMKGEGNARYLQNSAFLCTAVITGYQMYDVGWYPAIVSGDNLITGELYRVPIKDMPAIDMLEGEGTLYIKKCERVTDSKGNTTFAFVYIYNEDVSNLKKIDSWKEYVWYVSYGSNMLRERFMCYIKGGSYEGSRYRDPCDDTSLPIAVKTVEIPYDMYFGNESGSWENGGVSFIDTTKKGKALGVAYLITKKQFKHVREQENGGHFPGNGKWYTDIIDLGEMDGFEVKTITNKIFRRYNKPCDAYWDTLIKGIKENWPDMSDEDITDYLINCIR
ncbi:gamma-glutamylcyclotransferase family protein [Methanobrevibacter millerae]|uniref:Uncharacterized conserved protein YtfP, gamma-glutamylcyclotransferase (GGCT)/AIG2-like family n=1 Tax=Methanobrevibacter millerae TaxID=230361 RepID=A0A1G5VGT9_9EURY|nr:gamma-glutamylcyclotransferase family protein [Methanobrevibacter millerae]SDA45131.1 Uncharacterized conserved protein YtfP, gamma-glutamylcyclotransferase (GGCT)/AIG2-like family [Methanobrevibacter millerae]